MPANDLSAEIRQRHVRVPSMDPTAFLCDECVEPWPCDAIRAADAFDAAITERDAARRREQKYRETLEWYGGQEAWKHHRVPGTYASYYQEIDRDKGARARAALAPEQEAGS